MLRSTVTSVLAVVVALFAGFAYATVPTLVNYQAVLKDGSGTPLANTVIDVRFSIYDDASATNPALWTEAQSVMTDAQGQFAVLLGTVNPLTDAVFSGADRWLGTRVGLELTDLLPRTRIATVAYAFRTATVDGANGGTITSKVAIGPGHVTAGVHTFVAGSTNNATGDFSTVSGGYQNVASEQESSIGGGNNNTASGVGSRVGGGAANVASASYSTVPGGSANSATAMWATVAGGDENAAINNFATVGGGIGDTASGLFSTVPGGDRCVASGDYSFAAGTYARAIHNGSFVWADQSTIPFPSSATNEFSARCTGGARFVSAIDVGGASTAGVSLAVGGGSWSSISDMHLKENARNIDGERLLEQLAQIQISEWNYIAQDDSIRHIGPMAQDFYRAFGVGEDDKHITTIDADGVALAAIQELIKRITELEAELVALRAEGKATTPTR